MQESNTSGPDRQHLEETARQRLSQGKSPHWVWCRYPIDCKEHPAPGEGRRIYVAWPHDGGFNHDLNKRGYEQLAAIAGPYYTWTSDTRSMGINFWRAYFTEEGAARAREIPEVHKGTRKSYFKLWI